MTVTENINPKVVYEGPFEKDQILFFAFPYTDEDDIMCRVGTEDLVYNVDYEVEGQSVKLLKQIDDNVLTVYRRTPLDQQAEFPQNQRFNSAKLNDALDKLCMQQQEQREWLGRCVTADISMEGFNGELPLPQGDNVLKWNSDATALENYDIIGENNKFKEEVNQNFATLSDTLDNNMEAFKEEVTLMVEEVSDAAEKINQLESAVEEAKQAATRAETSESQAETAVEEARQAATRAETSESQAETAASIAMHQADEVKEIRDIIIPAIQEEGQQQIANIERTGFYMRDDKLYFINSDGEEEEFASGGGLEIGDIGPAPLGIDETKGKRRYLNGQVIIQEQYLQFTNKVKSAQALYPNLFVTEEQWQATVTMSAFGACYKFVVDDEAGTIRLPKITGFIQGLTDLSKLGDLVEAGLPDHSHNVPFYAGSCTGGSEAQQFGWSNPTSNLATKNASESNPTYGNSPTVQPESGCYPYFIQVATGAETEDNIINEIELNNPFSLLDYKYSEYELNNLSWLRSNGQYNSKATYPAVYDLLLKIYNGTEAKAGVSVKLSTEEFTDYDFVLNTSEETFKLPTKVKLASGNLITTSSDIEALNDISDWVVAHRTTSTGSWNDTSLGNTEQPPQTGAFTLNTSDSGLYLYFYVGETIQNANLINAGRIEEKIHSLIPDNSSLISGYGMPSDRYIDLTLGASGATYTMPSNGWLCCGCTGSGSYVELVNYKNNAETGLKVSATATYVGGWARASIPVSKGDTVNVYYGGTFTLKAFRFVYAQGSESEAN